MYPFLSITAILDQVTIISYSLMQHPPNQNICHILVLEKAIFPKFKSDGHFPSSYWKACYQLPVFLE